jgi:hypothetical protein
MPVRLPVSTTPWQGVRISLAYDGRDALSDRAEWVSIELAALGRSAPTSVLLAAMERHGYDRPHELLIDALCDEPDAFAFSAL